MLTDSLHDDAEVTRTPEGEVVVVLSTWLRPVQRLVVLSWIAGLLGAEPQAPLIATVRAGQVAARTPSVVGGRLAELMDLAAPTVAQRAEAIELLLRR